MKKFMTLALSMAMAASLCACGSTQPAAPAQTDAATEAAATEAATEAADGEVTSDSKYDEEAWKAEPAYGQTLHYWTGDSCTAATNLADAMGLFEEEGIKMEGFKGESDVEAIGTNQVQVAIGHIAKATVPATNGVNLTFVGGAHLLQGCKAMYVLADSEYETYDDLIGKKISVPNGIGASDYNITARLLLEAGINPLKDVTLTPVDKEACVAAMQNGELDAALLGETYGYKLVKEGVLRKIDSKDGNSRNEICCIIMMNRDFIAENPITADKIASVIKKTLKWMGEHPDETSRKLMELGLNGDDYEQNLELNTLMSFGLDDDYTTSQMTGICEDYIEAGLITSMDDPKAVLELLWNPIGSAE